MPPGRADVDDQRGTCFIPDAVVVGALHAQVVLAGIEIGKGHLMFVAEVNPMVAEAFQLVDILIVFGITKIQGGKFKGEGLILIAQIQPPLFGNTFFDNESSAGVGSVVAGKAGEHHRRDVRIIPDAVRMNEVDAVYPAKKDFTGAAFEAEIPGIKVGIQQPVIPVKILEGFSERIKAGKPIFGG